ncbi:beta-1,6-N-acetylglucosaminyltransferase [Butyrivibrio sp. YAB3001]|uniref:beta-1,6-N-acetylglucosaminyltransferase n=1 Tax=Butyrivibrio sp. YAB3001 TaxID=1520812 RepID=UPI0008F665E0|nr:beta-1,6-N-acetylglucosaminyltransferase [Butyrivibrio sp. YAB3001]SFD06785.1 Core-2/I-Branching enzyme [Butyrivibrio sp. YAB3001]
MNKDAFLIIAYKNDKTLQALISILDYPMNDIYLHMDAKCTEFNPDQDIPQLSFSKIFYTERTKVTWGAYSQINSELVLLKEACSNGHYRYYHLISGEDLPIKDTEYIYDFFEKYNGKEFIRFYSAEFDELKRVRYWYVFQELCGRRKNIYWYLNKGLVLLQNLVGIRRNKNIVFQKGTNWFSITDDLARYVIGNEKWIKRVFKYTYCCDEVFLQTIVYNSTFKDSLFHKEYDNDLHAIMRHIDWNRGRPYVFRKDDFNELAESEMLFARKFDCSIDNDIIEKIYLEFGK